MLQATGSEEARAFVLDMAKRAKENGVSTSLGAVTDNFVKKYDSPGKPDLFDAIRQLIKEGLLKVEKRDQAVFLSLSDAHCARA